jgi:hypothetical protein
VHVEDTVLTLRFLFTPRDFSRLAFGIIVDGKARWVTKSRRNRVYVSADS